MLLRIEKKKKIKESNPNLDVEGLFPKLSQLKDENDKKVVCFLADVASPFAKMEKESKIAKISDYLGVSVSRVESVYATCLQKDSENNKAFMEYSSFAVHHVEDLLVTSRILKSKLTSTLTSVDLDELNDKDDKGFDRVMKFYQQLPIINKEHDNLEAIYQSRYDAEIVEFLDKQGGFNTMRRANDIMDRKKEMDAEMDSQ